MDPTEVFVETQTRQGWRRLRLIGGVLLLLFCAGAAYYYYTSVQAERDLRNAVAHANQLDPGWTLPEIEARREVIPDAQNAILHVMTARQFQPTPPKSFQLFQDLEEMPPQEQLSEQQLESIAAEVMRAARLLEAARPIAILPKGRPNTALSQDVVSTILPHVDALSTLHIYLLFDVVKQAQEQNAEGAFRSARVMFNSARALGDEPFAMVQTNRMLRACNALRAVERVLAQGQVSALTLTEFQKLIEEEEAYPGFLIGARGERAILHVMMERLETSEISHTHMRKMLASFQQQKGPGRVMTGSTIFSSTGRLASSKKIMRRCLNTCRTLSKLPSFPSKISRKRWNQCSQSIKSCQPSLRL